MSDVASYSVRDGIAVITMKNPPVNGLGNALRAGIADGLKQAAADPEVKAVLFIGSSKVFSGGADIREFNKPMTPPNLPEVNDMQDAMQKPLVAAIGGFALGGGRDPEVAGRPARGEARHPAGLGRHAAPAARDPGARSRAHDHPGRPDPGGKGEGVRPGG